MSYEPVLTSNGLEIRDSDGAVVWGPSESYSWPPNAEMMSAVFDDASISQPNRAVFRLVAGIVDIEDER